MPLTPDNPDLPQIPGVETLSPGYLAAIRAAGPGSALYNQAYGASMAQGFADAETNPLYTGLPGPVNPAPPTPQTQTFNAGPQIAAQIQSQFPGASQIGPNTWQYNAPSATNLGAYAGTSGGEAPTSPTPSALNYLGLPNYSNLGSNFSGGSNYSNPFAGLFGNPSQTNFLSTWT